MYPKCDVTLFLHESKAVRTHTNYYCKYLQPFLFHNSLTLIRKGLEKHFRTKINDIKVIYTGNGSVTLYMKFKVWK